MKYYINVIYRSNTRNAGTKAPSDVSKILEKEGYVPLNVIEPFNKRRYISFVISLCQYICIFLRIKKNDIIFLQYPNYLHKVDFFYNLIIKRQPQIQILIHDLDSLKVGNKTENVVLLQKANLVIAHTTQMKEILQTNFGLKNQIKVLNLFDYLVEKECLITSNLKDTLVYAGNLANNMFLRKLKTQTYIYGKKEEWLKQNEYMHYEGEFEPEDLSVIKGDWGLLWYGNSIDKFDDTLLGRYCTFISSHKASLYLAAAKPIITWKNTAMGDFIEKEKLGIAVDSLNNIDSVISQLSESEKNTIKRNVLAYSIKIRQGRMLASVITSQQ